MMRVSSNCVPSWSKILVLSFICLMLIMLTMSGSDRTHPARWSGLGTWMAENEVYGFPYETYETLSNGYTMPYVGLGTWLAEKEVVGKTIEEALKYGYRAVDCAHAYGNQPEIGAAFNKVFRVDRSVRREDVFITSKVWNTFHSYEKAKEEIDIILRELQLDYIDLMLIHWPMGYKEGGELFPMENGKRLYSDEDYLNTWRAMEEAVEAGKIRSIGLSNFNHKQVRRVIEHAKIKPVALQVECHPYFQQRKIRAWLKNMGIAMIAYSPLGSKGNPYRKKGDPIIMDEPVIKAIAEVHGKTPAQVVLRWNVQQGTHVIPKSTNPDHWKANLDVFSFNLSDEEMRMIGGIDKNWRILNLFKVDAHHPHYPFTQWF